MAGGGVCPFTLTKELLYHSLLTGLVFLVVVGQGVLLDAYIISNDHTAIINYFWILPDFLLVFAFVAAMASGYKNCMQEMKQTSNQQTNVDTTQVKVKGSMSILGEHPLPFGVWMIYSCLLVVKVAIIFKSEIPNKIGDTNFLSPQLLKGALASTGLVFAFLIEGQSRIEPSTDREIYIKRICHETVFEILDSVTFLSLLIQSESELLFSYNIENVIIAFSCLNFLLPSLTLVGLSRSNYGSSALCLVCSITYRMLHLWLINFSYFVIRLHLWTALSVSVSPFIIKNVFHICFSMKTVWKEGKDLYALVGNYVHKKRRVYDTSPVTAEAELNAATTSTNDWTANNDRFEEIDLKSDFVSGNP